MVSPKINRAAYVRARLLEVLSDLSIGINMWLVALEKLLVRFLAQLRSLPQP